MTQQLGKVSKYGSSHRGCKYGPMITCVARVWKCTQRHWAHRLLAFHLHTRLSKSTKTLIGRVKTALFYFYIVRSCWTCFSRLSFLLFVSKTTSINPKICHITVCCVLVLCLKCKICILVYEILRILNLI